MEKKSIRLIFLKSVWIFLKTSSISLAGGIIIFGLLNIPTLSYGLSPLQWLWVSFLVFLTIIVFVVLAGNIESLKNKEIMTFKFWLNTINDFLKYPLLVGHLLLIIVILFLLVVYTGYMEYIVDIFLPENMKLLWEKIEILIPLGPRLKEILLGYPLFLLALVMFFKGESKNLVQPLIIIGAFTQIFILKNFCDFSSFYVSVLKTVNGLWIGIIIGLIWAWLYKQYKNFEKKDVGL